MRLRAMPRRPDKSLGHRRIVLSWQAGMPEAWRSYMRSAAYWGAELENENGR